MKGDNKYSVGRLIKSIRKSLRLSQSIVCGGLCSLNAFVKIEQGIFEPNPYLVSLFFQRMGIAVNKYGLVYSKKEYAELEKRCAIIQCLKEKNFSTLPALLCEYEKLVKMMNYQKQFIAYAELVSTDSQETGSKALIEKGMKAIRLTIPDFEPERAEVYHYSRIERALAAFIADQLYETGQKDQSVCILQKLLRNMEQLVLDEEELVRGYPELACLLTEKLWEMGRYEERYFCEKAIELLYSCQELNGVLTHLKYRQISWLQLPGSSPDTEEITAWEKKIEALEQLEQEKQIAETFRQDIFCLLIEESIQGVPLEKLFKSVRHGVGITGAEACEQICEPENYSRIERGVVKPYMENYQELMKRMGREGYRYYPNVVSEDYEAHLLYREVTRDIEKFQYTAAADKLAELVRTLDMEDEVNQQRIQYKQAILSMRLGEIDAAQKKNQLEKCLHLTVPENVDWTTYPLNDTEVVILNGIAIAEYELGNIDEAIRLLENIKKVCESNPLYVLNDRKMYLLVLYNLTRFLGQRNEHMKAEGLACECSEIACKMGMSFDFLSFCYLEIWNIEQMMKRQGQGLDEIQKKCMLICKKIISAAEALGQYKIKSSIMSFWKKYLGLIIS